MSLSYADLTNATGRISLRAVMALANSRARQEVAKCGKFGWARQYRDVLREELVTIWIMAKTSRDGKLYAAERAALPASEQIARTLDLAAELAATAIPPRHVEAAELRARATAIRFPAIVSIAACAIPAMLVLANGAVAAETGKIIAHMRAVNGRAGIA